MVNKRVTFHETDDIEQKIDKLMTMMGKLVTEDERQSKPFKLQVYQSNKGRRQNRGSYQGIFRSNNVYGDIQYTIRTLEAGWHIILIAEVIMVIMHEVIRGIQVIIIIIEGKIIGIDFMIEIGVGHLKDRIGVGEMTEVWVAAGRDQVLEQVQTETGLGFLNVGSMAILWGSVQQDKRVGKWTDTTHV